MSRSRTVRSFSEELPALLDERKLSLRAVAKAAEVDPAHLSRVLRRASGKTVSPELATRVAEALDLPGDYFPESREAVIVKKIKEDPKLRDRIYDQIQT